MEMIRRNSFATPSPMRMERLLRGPRSFRLVEIAVASNISLSKISRAERGLCQLSEEEDRRRRAAIEKLSRDGAA